MELSKGLQVRFFHSQHNVNLESSMLKWRTSQEINIQNVNVELVAQMFKNYQSNVLFHLEGMSPVFEYHSVRNKLINAFNTSPATDSLQDP